MTASARAKRLIWLAAYLAVAAIAGDFVLLALNAGSIGPAPSGPDLALRIEIPIFGVAFVLIGALIASRQPRTRLDGSSGPAGSRRRSNR